VRGKSPGARIISFAALVRQYWSAPGPCGVLMRPLGPGCAIQ